MLTASSDTVIANPAWQDEVHEDRRNEFSSDTAVSAHTNDQVVELPTAPAIERRERRRLGSVAQRSVRTWIRGIDFVIVFVAICVASVHASIESLVRDVQLLDNVTFPVTHVIALVGCAGAWLKVNEAFWLYSPPRQSRVGIEALRIVLAAALGTVLTSAVLSWIGAKGFEGEGSITGSLLLFAIVTLLSASIRLLASLTNKRPLLRRLTRQVLIIGSGPRAVEYYNALMRDSRTRANVIGFVDTAKHSALTATGMELIGRLRDLESLLTRAIIDEVYVALPLKSCYQEAQRAIHMCERVGIRAIYNVEAFDHRIRPATYFHIGRMPVAVLSPVQHHTHLPWKRVFDIFVSGVAIVALTPLVVIIALLVASSSRGPIIFQQERFGQNKRPFKMYKFRSMRIDAEETLKRDPALWDQYQRNHFKIPENQDSRVTPLGRFLRKTSLDELPQLWNVFKGDMSVIGPRPIVPAEITHYGPFAPLLLALKPGLTGAWVIGGRSAVGYPHRAELELSYVRQWSLWRDAKIFLQTIPAVLRGRGAH